MPRARKEMKKEEAVATVVKEQTAIVGEAPAAAEKASAVAENISAAAEKAPAAEKKAAAPKRPGRPRKNPAAGAKAEPKTASKRKIAADVYVQYMGKEVSEKEILEKIVDKYISQGNKKSSIKSLEVYIKPEDNAAYYVINGQGDSVSL